MVTCGDAAIAAATARAAPQPVVCGGRRVSLDLDNEPYYSSEYFGNSQFDMGRQ